MAGILTIAKNFVFPPKCVFCDGIMEINSAMEVCGHCSSELSFCEDFVCCVKCGKPLVSFGEKQLCYFCIEKNSQSYNRIVSVFKYDKIARDSILRYKALELWNYAKIYGDCLAARILNEYSGINFDFLCSVPPHKKLWGTRLDRMEKVASVLSKKLSVPFKKRIFVRKRKTVKQSSLGFYERQENMKNSLAVRKSEDISGNTVLVIDDVCTTRASLSECARALKAEGAKAVYGATIATVTRKSYLFNNITNDSHIWAKGTD